VIIRTHGNRPRDVDAAIAPKSLRNGGFITLATEAIRRDM